MFDKTTTTEEKKYMGNEIMSPGLISYIMNHGGGVVEKYFDSWLNGWCS